MPTPDRRIRGWDSWELSHGDNHHYLRQRNTFKRWTIVYFPFRCAAAAGLQQRDNNHIWMAPPRFPGTVSARPHRKIFLAKRTTKLTSEVYTPNKHKTNHHE